MKNWRWYGGGSMSGIPFKYFNFLWAKNINFSFHRDIFRTHKLWPTFIGVKVDPLLEFKGILPVLLWPEQRRYSIVISKLLVFCNLLYCKLYLIWKFEINFYHYFDRHILLSTEKPQTSRKKRKLDYEELAGERIEKVEAPKKKLRSFSLIDFNAPLIEQPPLVIATAFLSMIKNVFSGAFNTVKATLFESSSAGSSDSLVDSGIQYLITEVW